MKNEVFQKLLLLKVLNSARMQRQKRSPKAAIVTQRKDVLGHETEISVASIPVQEQKVGALSMPRKLKRELEDLQAGVKYHKTYHTKNAKTEYEREMILPAKELEQKRRKE